MSKRLVTSKNICDIYAMHASGNIAHLTKYDGVHAFYHFLTYDDKTQQGIELEFQVSVDKPQDTFVLSQTIEEFATTSAKQKMTVFARDEDLPVALCELLEAAQYETV